MTGHWVEVLGLSPGLHVECRLAWRGQLPARRPFQGGREHPNPRSGLAPRSWRHRQDLSRLAHSRPGCSRPGPLRRLQPGPLMDPAARPRTSAGAC